MDASDFNTYQEARGTVYYPYPVGREPYALPQITGAATRISRESDPFLFRAVGCNSEGRGMTGALIEHVRWRYHSFSRDQPSPIGREELEGRVSIAVWEYRDLELINARSPSVRNAFYAPGSIVRDPGEDADYMPWQKLFDWAYRVPKNAGGEEHPSGVIMPSAAGADLHSIVVPRRFVFDPTYFTPVKTETRDIPQSVIEYVLGHTNPPDGWVA